MIVILAKVKEKRSATTGTGPTDKKSCSSTAIDKVFDKYAEAAVILAFSVQIAALVLIIKKLFGFSAVDFGSLTVEVTWAAALLAMLPMPIVHLISAESAEQGRDNSTSRPEGHDTTESRDLRLVWIMLAWALFFFTFTCRMANRYSSGQVGDGPSKVISDAEAENIKELCFRRRTILPNAEEVAFDFFALGGSLFVSFVIIGIVIDAVGQKGGWAWSTRIRKSGAFAKANSITGRAILILNVVLWGLPQLWTIFRFRGIQAALAQSINMVNNDNTWSFGQIMAVVVFLPVVVQCIYEFGHQPESDATSANDVIRVSRSQKTV